MKQFVVTLLLATLSISQLMAQDFSDLKGKMLKDSAEYAETQPRVLDCCEFLLNSPLKNDENNLIAFDFLVEWMNNNPYYYFVPNKKFYKTISNDAALSARYFAALCQTAITSNFKIEESELQYQAIDKTVRYSMYKKYKVQIDKKLQKYVDAKKDGKLKEII